MGNLWLKIKVWTKIVLFSALAFYVLLFMYNNWDNQVKLWIWFRTEPWHSVLLYMLFAFLTGVIGTILVRTAQRTIAQIRELRERSRTEKAERRMADLESKASRLQQRRQLAAAPRTKAAPKPAAALPQLEARPAEPAPAPRVESRVVPEPETHPVSEGSPSNNGTPK